MSAAHDPDRIQGFDGIRGIGMMAVVCVHAVQAIALSAGVTSWQVPAVRPIDDFAWTVIRYSWTAVDIFFVLSGYLITGILLRSKDGPHYFRNFYARRVLRIFPLYYLVVLLRLYVWPMHEGGYPGAQQAAHLAYLSNVWFALYKDAGVVDPALGLTWSLSIEEHFYLVWPLLVAMCSRAVLLRLCVGFVLGALALRVALVLAGVHWEFVWLFTLCRIDTMAVGAILAIRGQQSVRRLGLWVTAAIAGQGLAIALDDSNASGPWMQTLGYTSNALWGGCLVVLALRAGAASRVLSWPFLQLYGRHSYAIYLSHHLLVDRLADWCIDHSPGGVLQRLAEGAGMLLPSVVLFMLVSVLCALLLGWVLWHVVEQPFLSLRRFFVVRSPTPRPATTATSDVRSP